MARAKVPVMWRAQRQTWWMGCCMRFLCSGWDDWVLVVYTRCGIVQILCLRRPSPFLLPCQSCPHGIPRDVVPREGTQVGMGDGIVSC